MWGLAPEAPAEGERRPLHPRHLSTWVSTHLAQRRRPVAIQTLLMDLRGVVTQPHEDGGQVHAVPGQQLPSENV